MTLAPAQPRDPRQAQIEGGREGARRRWGPNYTPRVLRVDSLPPEYRTAVEVLIRAARNAEKASGSG